MLSIWSNPNGVGLRVNAYMSNFGDIVVEITYGWVYEDKLYWSTNFQVVPC